MVTTRRCPRDPGQTMCGWVTSVSEQCQCRRYTRRLDPVVAGPVVAFSPGTNDDIISLAAAHQLGPGPEVPSVEAGSPAS